MGNIALEVRMLEATSYSPELVKDMDQFWKDLAEHSAKIDAAIARVSAMPSGPGLPVLRTEPVPVSAVRRVSLSQGETL